MATLEVQEIIVDPHEHPQFRFGIGAADCYLFPISSCCKARIRQCEESTMWSCEACKAETSWDGCVSDIMHRSWTKDYDMYKNPMAGDCFAEWLGCDMDSLEIKGE